MSFPDSSGRQKQVSLHTPDRQRAEALLAEFRASGKFPAVRQKLKFAGVDLSQFHGGLVCRQHHALALRTLQILTSQANRARFEFLTAKPSTTVLATLGRCYREDVILEVAEHICEHKLSGQKARALILDLRKARVKQPSFSRDLRRAIARLAEAYDIPPAQVASHLEIVRWDYLPKDETKAA